MPASASGTVTKGTVSVTSGSLNVREEPKVSSSAIGSLSKGDEVTIIETVTDSSGALDSSGNVYKWYKIEYGSSYGYVRSDYISNITETPDSGGSESTSCYGLISALNTNVNLRSGAGTSYSKVGELEDCQLVSVYGSTTLSSGVTWYKIKTSDGTEGYVHQDYIKVSSVASGTDTTDSEFESYIKAKFPSSYWDYLRKLHIIYPEWSFIPYSAGDWDEAVSAESKLGVSLVSSSALSSWKSTESGAYNWETGVWTPMDGSSWVAASQEIVEYFMDPRNFLGPDTAFQFLYQGFDETTQSKSGLLAIIADTFLADTSVDTDADSSNGVTTYSDTIYTAGSTYKVNPYVLAAMIIQEIGRDGTSGSISGTVEGYEGLYNFFNIGAYATDDMTAIQRGLWYAGGGNNNATTYNRPWTTRYKSILGGTEFYAGTYISNGQHTLYTKRFNVAPVNTEKYTHQYMTNAGGAASEGYILSDAYSETMRTLALGFYIPVYENMPDSECEMPTKTGSPNNRLESLAVNGFTLTPSFSYSTTSYSLVVENSVSSVSVSAAAFDSTASIKVNGTSLTDGKANVKLSVGDNTIKVNVTAENGDLYTYTITIARQSGSTSVTVSSDVYTISDNIIKKVEPSTTLSAFAANITLTDSAYFTVTSSSGSVKADSEIVGTGDKVIVYNSDGSVFNTFTVLIYGDVTGDGAITNSDLIKIRNHILSTVSLTDVYATAADVTKDASVSNSDLIKVRNHILNTSAIEQ